MHLFMLILHRMILLSDFSFGWVCCFPLICFLSCPPCFSGTSTPWYQKSDTANRWSVNSAGWGSCHWWALQSRSPASRYLFWIPKICVFLIMYMCCRVQLTGELGVQFISPLWLSDWLRTAIQLRTGSHHLYLRDGSIFSGLYYSDCFCLFL